MLWLCTKCVVAVSSTNLKESFKFKKGILLFRHFQLKIDAKFADVYHVPKNNQTRNTQKRVFYVIS